MGFGSWSPFPLSSGYFLGLYRVCTITWPSQDGVANFPLQLAQRSIVMVPVHSSALLGSRFMLSYIFSLHSCNNASHHVLGCGVRSTFILHCVWVSQYCAPEPSYKHRPNLCIFREIHSTQWATCQSKLVVIFLWYNRWREGRKQEKREITEIREGSRAILVSLHVSLAGFIPSPLSFAIEITQGCNWHQTVSKVYHWIHVRQHTKQGDC